MGWFRVRLGFSEQTQSSMRTRGEAAGWLPSEGDGAGAVLTGAWKLPGEVS